MTDRPDEHERRRELRELSLALDKAEDAEQDAVALLAQVCGSRDRACRATKDARGAYFAALARESLDVPALMTASEPKPDYPLSAARDADPHGGPDLPPKPKRQRKAKPKIEAQRQPLTRMCCAVCVSALEPNVNEVTRHGLVCPRCKDITRVVDARSDDGTVELRVFVLAEGSAVARAAPGKCGNWDDLTADRKPTEEELAEFVGAGLSLSLEYHLAAQIEGGGLAIEFVPVAKPGMPGLATRDLFPVAVGPYAEGT